MAFGKLREVFHIEAAEFMKSICGAPAQPRVAVFHAVFNGCYCHIVCLQRLSRGECWGRASTFPSITELLLSAHRVCVARKRPVYPLAPSDLLNCGEKEQVM